ncbi:phage tail tube protein [Paenibacillus sp. PAMC21692]|jgi:hypothetical protein|uniref:phage tail tube protein n=1 Tax=Paenibacillus sp. PAMC21692 TaxID=2762320 RepID=UPI00164D2D35|nr:phage tail tube protein [Paenibacillus sp. PAMC21692]QNK57551.1 phage tail tube protein [Paenibacillus sp. PAMC21692]
MAYMNVEDTISGKQAKAIIKIGKQQEELFYAKTGEATIEKTKADVPMLGKTSIGKKTMGWTGTGTLTIYYVTSKFRQLMEEYAAKGTDFYFELMIVNEDPASRTGKQAVTLKRCNLDSVLLAKFDAAGEDTLEEELPFTFEDFTINTPFTAL